MPPPTIIAHKSAFLATQTLHLSQALAPSPAWLAANERAEDGGLSKRAVDDAVYRLNHALTQHSRRVYAPQATRHVAEQIEGLFYEAAERALRDDDDDDDDDDDNGDNEGGGNGGEGGSGRGGGGGGRGGEFNIEKEKLKLGTDFTTDEAISSLPPTWPSHKRNQEAAAAHPLEARRYAELASTLTTLSTRRLEVRDRVDRLRRMAALLAPFGSHPNSNPNDDETSDPDPDPDNTTLTTATTHATTTAAAAASATRFRAQTTIQENLITRNGEVERELERMRLLLARVSGRVAQLPSSSSHPPPTSTTTSAEVSDPTDLDSLERDKIDRLLDQL